MTPLTLLPGAGSFKLLLRTPGDGLTRRNRRKKTSKTCSLLSELNSSRIEINETTSEMKLFRNCDHRSKDSKTLCQNHKNSHTIWLACSKRSRNLEWRMPTRYNEVALESTLLPKRNIRFLP